MIAQAEKKTAEELLYGSEIPAPYSGGEEVLTKFNYGHNLGEYERLVKDKYAEAPSFAPGSYEAPAPAGGVYAEPAGAKLDNYYVEESAYAPSIEPQQEYWTDDKPIPYQTFRPQIFEYDDVNAPPASAADTSLEEIATVDVIEQLVQAEEPYYGEAAVPHLKLNAKGAVFVASFAAVFVLLTVMLIINSIAISGGTAMISQLASQNAEISAALNNGSNSLTQQRNDAYEQGVDNAESLRGKEGYEPAGQIALPSLPPAPNIYANPDASTNIFDQVVKFISSIFG